MTAAEWRRQLREKRYGVFLAADPELKALDRFTVKQAKQTMPFIHLRRSALNIARKRYLYGDDSALDET